MLGIDMQISAIKCDRPSQIIIGGEGEAGDELVLQNETDMIDPKILASPFFDAIDDL